MDDRRLSDDEVRSRIRDAWCALGDEKGASPFGNAMLDGVRKVLAAAGASFAVRDAAEAIDRAQSAVRERRRSPPPRSD